MSPLQLVIHMVQDCNAEEQEIHLDKTNKRQSVTACGYCFSFVEYIAVQKGMYNPKKEKKRQKENQRVPKANLWIVNYCILEMKPAISLVVYFKSVKI